MWVQKRSCTCRITLKCEYACLDAIYRKVVGSTNICRLCFYVSASTSGSMDLLPTFQSASMWLHVMCMSQVSCFTFLCLTDFYTLHLASTLPSNKFFRMLCVVGGWLG